MSTAISIFYAIEKLAEDLHVLCDHFWEIDPVKTLIVR